MQPDKSDRILRLPAVLERTGLSRSTLYRKVECGTFPRQIKLSVRCAGWRESSIEAWLKNPIFYSADDTDAWSLRSALLGDLAFKLRDPLGTDRMDGAAEFLDLGAQPFELLGADAIMFGVARLHIGILELLEHRPLLAALTRPDIEQSIVQPLGLGAQKAQIVIMRSIEGADQKDAVIEAFRGLV
jgi:prophage regulatory protein